MNDRDWRTSARDAATLWLITHEQPAVAVALWRSTIVGMRRINKDRLGIKIAVEADDDLAVLARATRSWTDSPLPGALDLAFEHWLPAGDWPVFAFEQP
jgi:hypothetical protein